jgi:excinuclease ABC subunit C
MFDLQQALKELPDHPGVYIMKNQQGEIIYIGKAISLKNRVKQYFQRSSSHTPKVKAMVKHIAEFEYILVDNEMEALILECNLIKKHRPRYNILLKDDKHYPYIKITLNEEYPRVMVTRRVLKDGARYFGPYSDAGAVRDTLETLRKLYPVRSCSKGVGFGRRIDRPCLNFHIGRCMAPCQGNVDRESYMKSINRIITFLSGKNDEIIDELNTSMNDASENLEFERAAAIRDEINALERILEKQKITTTAREDQDVIACYRSTFGTCVAIFFVRGGKLLGRENFFFDDVEEDEGELLQQFVAQFYSNVDYVPKLVLLHKEVPEIETLEQYLSEKRGSKVEIRVPKWGEKSELMDMATLNAQAAFEQMRFKQIKERQMTEGAIEELQVVLDLEKPPSRIEAYDISNIQGTDPVASMVVFENGRPSKKDYRRFKIKTVEGPNDYASMREVIQRRLQRGISEREKLQQEGKDLDIGRFS